MSAISESRRRSAMRSGEGRVLRVASAVAEPANPTELRAIERFVRDGLRKQGVDFEGRRLRVSLTPTILEEGEVRSIGAASGLIRTALGRVISRFRQEHRRADFKGPLHRAFEPYRRWWGLIAQEHRLLPDIGLMRFDCIRRGPHDWKILETNTACAGGTTVCPIVRRLWASSPPIRRHLQSYRWARLPQDNETAFVRHLHRLAVRIAGNRTPVVAALNHRGDLHNEMDLWKRVFDRLASQGALGGEFLLGDIREVETREGQAFLRGRRLSLIHNKVDPMGVDPDDPEIQGWIASSRLESLEFLNSFAAMYLTEAKRVLDLLRRSDLQREVGMLPWESAAVDRLVPWTRVLRRGDLSTLNLVRRFRHRFVLKADALTRGEGVFMGNRLSSQEWDAAIRTTLDNFGVVQERIAAPREAAFETDGQRGLRQVEEYSGVDLFFFGSEFVGTAGRCHLDPVFNVGNGGKERPVLVLAESAYSEPERIALTAESMA